MKIYYFRDLGHWDHKDFLKNIDIIYIHSILYAHSLMKQKNINSMMNLINGDLLRCEKSAILEESNNFQIC